MIAIDVDVFKVRPIRKASGLSPTNIARMTASWHEDYQTFSQRSLDDRDYVYLWADGIHVNVRLEEDRLCWLGWSESSEYAQPPRPLSILPLDELGGLRSR